MGADRPLRNEERTTLITDLGAATGRSIVLVDLARVGEPLLGRIVTKGTRILGDERYARLLSRHLLDAADFLP